MTHRELKDAVMAALEAFLSDCEVPQSQTKEELREFIIEIEGMIESLTEDDDD